MIDCTAFLMKRIHDCLDNGQSDSASTIFTCSCFVLEGRVKQMGGSVRAAHALAALDVDARGHGVAELEAAGDDLAGMHILAALVLLHVGNFKFCVAAGDDAVVGDLAAHLGVERGLVEHDDALDTAHHLLGLLALDHQRDELRKYTGSSKNEYGNKKKCRCEMAAYCRKHAETELGEIVLTVVCDGMGGLDKGELASATVIRGFANWFEQELPTELAHPDLSVIAQKWKLMLKELNEKISSYGQRQRAQLGTTVTAILCLNDQFL